MTTSLMQTAAVAALIAMGSAQAISAQGSAVQPGKASCAADPNFRAFDFWIGEWDVQPTGATRGPIGSGSTSIIERQLDGCVVQEKWLPGAARRRQELNLYNR